MAGTVAELGTSDLRVNFNNSRKRQFGFKLHDLAHSIKRTKNELVDVAIVKKLKVVTK
jgi:hypothetical protein